jgi:hypothetical protein
MITGCPCLEIIFFLEIIEKNLWFKKIKWKKKQQQKYLKMT